jgi:hypothetical protein
VGGVKKDEGNDPARDNPELAVPLEKLEQVKNQDSPAELFEMLRKGAHPDPRNRQELVKRMRRILHSPPSSGPGPRRRDPGAAQSIHWDPPGGTLPVGEVSQLQLVFDECSPDDVPVPPKVDGLRLDYQGQSSQVSIINGTFSKNVSMTFAVLLSKQSDVDIPGFSVNTNKGPVRVAGVHFAPAGATVGSTGISLGDAAAAHLEPSSQSVWAGEVFDLKYSIDAATSYYPSWGRSAFEWDSSPLVTEDWSQPEPFESGSRTGLRFHTRAMAPSAGAPEAEPDEPADQPERRRLRLRVLPAAPVPAVRGAGLARVA